MVESLLAKARDSAAFALSARLKEPAFKGRGGAWGSLAVIGGDPGGPIGLELLSHAGTTKSCRMHDLNFSLPACLCMRAISIHCGTSYGCLWICCLCARWVDLNSGQCGLISVCTGVCLAVI